MADSEARQEGLKEQETAEAKEDKTIRNKKDTKIVVKVLFIQPHHMKKKKRKIKEAYK